MMKKNKKNHSGFTLVELIVVLVILAILAAILIPALLGYIDRARDAELLTKSRQLMTAIQAEIPESYAVGKFTIDGKQYTGEFTSKNVPSIREAALLSEIEDLGDPGMDYVYENGYAIYNGFGFGKSSPTMREAKYHFKVLIGSDSKIEDFVFCDIQRERMAHWSNGKFEIKSSGSCGHYAPTVNNKGKVYNYLYINDAKSHYLEKIPRW